MTKAENRTRESAVKPPVVHVPVPTGRRDDARAFLPDPTELGHRRVKDDFAEELGEDFVTAITTGESVDDARDAEVPEEEGGPFVTTSARQEFADDVDASNPEDAEPAAFPTTRSDRR